MSNPKAKAEELVNKMNVIHYVKLGGKNKDCKGLPVSMHHSQAKQCALIAVDEIKKALSDEQDWYWDDVKNEIEKQ